MLLAEAVDVADAKPVDVPPTEEATAEALAVA